MDLQITEEMGLTPVSKKSFFQKENALPVGKENVL